MAETTTINFPCTSCGGSLAYQPGQSALSCPYCGAKQDVDTSPPPVHEELDFESAKRSFASLSTQEVRIAHCSSCGGDSTLAPNVESAECHFCGTRLVVQGPSVKAMPPQYLIPFIIEKKSADNKFKVWIKKRWFAPNALKTMASVDSPLKGIYFPYYTFDTDTRTWYFGERGINYTVQVQGKDSNGNSVTRTETRIRWTPVTGTVSRFFDDTLVPASESLPPALTKNLSDWNLAALIEPKPEFLSGFIAETYSKTLETGFADAQEIMTQVIREDVRRNIGGDHQRIHDVRINWSGITFKYVQLPVWTLTYRFGKKFYQVLVNGQSGEIRGQRPWSVIKILLAVAAGGALIAAIAYALQYVQ